MRRVVSHVPSTPKSTWFSWTPSSSVSPAVASRRTSSSARAGTIASSSGTSPSIGVSLYESRYESVAAMTSFPSPKRTRMPVSTGRASSRETARPTEATRGEQRRRHRPCASARHRCRAAAGSPRRCRCSAGIPPGHSRTCRTFSSSRYSSSTPRCRAAGATGRRAACPGTTTAPSPVTCGVERGPDRELHVGRSELDLAAGCTQQDPAEDLHGCAGRDTRGRRLRASARARLARRRCRAAVQRDLLSRNFYITHVL